MSDAERLATFDDALRRAVFFGEYTPVSCDGLNGQTWNAIGVVAGQFPNVAFESVLLARAEFERPVDWRALCERYAT